MLFSFLLVDEFSSLHRLMAALSPKESKEVWKHLCNTGQVPEMYKERMCSNKDEEGKDEEGKTTPAEQGSQNDKRSDISFRFG